LLQRLGKLKNSMNLKAGFIGRFFKRINLPTHQKILPALV